LYEGHKLFKKPEDENIKIWRYMDFAKFVSLINNKALFFARSDAFEDPYDGVYPTANDDFFNNRDASLDFSKKIKKDTYINCWHINEHESAAMWKLYLNNGQGIAIQSTFNRLKDSFNSIRYPIYIGEVEYIDFSKESIPYNTERWAVGDYIGQIKGARANEVRINKYPPFLYKRKSFEHEKELRVILGNGNDFKEPVYVDVDLNKLIDCIYIAPTTDSWFDELVKSIIPDEIAGKEIIKSVLYDLK
jgi:hypothetical protein